MRSVAGAVDDVAASPNSLGMLRKNCRSRKMKSPVSPAPPNQPG